MFPVLARLLQALRRDAGSECVLVTGSRFPALAKAKGDEHLLEGLRVVTVDEVTLSRKLSALNVTPAIFAKLAYSAADHPALRLLADEIVHAGAGPEPDVLLSCDMPNGFLADAWPRALKLHIEGGPYHRNPFPPSIFFDHLGMYGQSIIGRAGAQLRGLTASPEAGELVRAFRRRNQAALASVDPFQAYDLRNGFERICLLPLQVSGWYGFDELCPYRTQFEFLFDVLSAAPREIGVVVTEHDAGERMLAKSIPHPNQTLEYLRQTFPNFIYAKQFAAYSSPSQFLVPRVDGVWSISSGVGQLALLFEKSLGAPESSYLAGIAHATTLAGFFADLGRHAPENRDGFLAWLLERYLVPEGLYTDGAWLNKYLERRIDAARAANDPVEAFVPTADVDRLKTLWINRAPPPQARRYSSVEDSLEALLLSRSWRLTAPLRAAAQSLRALRNRAHA
jgi:hypothetical protein